MELKQVRRFVLTRQHGHRNQELDVIPINIVYSSSYEDYDDKVEGLEKKEYKE